jgi:hypothetical protein
VPPRTLDTISSGNRSEASNIELIFRTQKELQNNLSSQRAHHLRALDAMSNVLLDTVKIQYAALPPRYLLVVDRGQSNTREVFKKATLTFCRVKRLNYLALAMGLWKILLVDKETLTRRPKYAKIASVHLLQGWLQNRKTKQIKLWFSRFRNTISKSIFLERENAALPIQSLYRCWRDRKKFIRMHLAGPYNGPLSDIYLAPHRLVKFYIPRIIRSTRRMLWQAAILIQTQWRRYFLQKDFLAQLRKVILVQSLLRRYPKMIQYRRLKATTIKCQAWVRRTVKRNAYKWLKRATLIVQKYVRRYLAILLKNRLCNALWEVQEQPLIAAIKIQCRWRIRRARKKVRNDCP